MFDTSLRYLESNYTIYFNQFRHVYAVSNTI